jgi:hypothetical protein
MSDNKIIVMIIAATIITFAVLGFIIKPPHQCRSTQEIIESVKKCKQEGLGFTSFASCQDCCTEILQCDINPQERKE